MQERHEGQHVGRNEPREQLHAPGGGGEADHGAGRHEDTTLGHELTEETEAGCPECAAERQFPLAALGSDQEQARHVRARDQEQQPGPAEQCEQHRAEDADDDFRQGKHAGTLAAVRVRVLFLELPGDDLRVGERRLDRDTLLEPGNPLEAVAASPQVARTRRVDRRPQLHRPPGRELEIPGKHADDGVGHAAERDAPADHVRACAEPRSPGRIAEDHGVGRPWQILAGQEVPAEHRRHAQRAEEVVADAGARNQLGALLRGQHVAAAGVDRQRREDRVLPLPVQVVRIREVGAGHLRGGLGDVNEPGGIGIWERFDQGGVHEGEDRDARAQAQAEHQDRRHGEAGILDELPDGEADVLRQVLDEGHSAALAVVLPGRFQAAQFQDRIPPRRLGRHAGPHVVLDVHLQVAFQLLRKRAIPLIAPEQPAQPRHPRTELAHIASSPGARNRARTAVACSQCCASFCSCLPSRPRQPVEPGLAVVLRDAPLGRDGPFLLQLQQRRVQGAVVQREQVAAGLLDSTGDPVAVQRPHRLDGLQHHQRQRPLPDVRLAAHAVSSCLAIGMMPAFQRRRNRNGGGPDSPTTSSRSATERAAVERFTPSFSTSDGWRRAAIQRRHRAEREGARHRDREREREHAAIQRHRVEPGDSVRREPDHALHRRPGKRKRNGGSSQREHQRFSEELAHHAATGGAQRDAERNFGLPAKAARASSKLATFRHAMQKRHRDRPEQDEKRRPHARRHRIVERADCHALPPVGPDTAVDGIEHPPAPAPRSRPGRSRASIAKLKQPPHVRSESASAMAAPRRPP